MSFWRTLLSRFSSEQKATSLDLLRDLYGGRVTRSGAAVNWRTALDVTTVLACARVIAEGIAQVPFKIYRESGKTRLPATAHPLYFLLSRRPNRWQTSYEFRETMGLHLALCSNAYAYISRVGSRVIELIQFEPQWVTVERDAAGVVTYKVAPPNSEPRLFAAEDIWHVRGPAWSSHVGMDAVHLAREAIGLALSTEEAHARLHSNGVRPSGMYSVEGTLTDVQQKQLTKWLEEAYAGSHNSGRPLVVDRAAKWTSQAMTGVDAQHLETRKYQVEEICRAMRVMPIMVGYSDKASTYASAEQMFLAHVVHTLSPWYERIEQSVDAQLLGDADVVSGYYSCFEEEGLMRATPSTTADYLLKLVNGGLMTPNEGRAVLDLNPDEEYASDELRIPVNVVADTSEPPDAAMEPAPAGEEN